MSVDMPTKTEEISKDEVVVQGDKREEARKFYENLMRHRIVAAKQEPASVVSQNAGCDC
jgi:hypothetical protein